MTHVTNVAELKLDRICYENRRESTILFSSYQTRAVLDPWDPRRSGSKGLFRITPVTTQNRDDACHERRWTKIGSDLFRSSTRNRRFYSHYTRPARFSTHEIREGLDRKICLESLLQRPRIVMTHDNRGAIL